MIESAIQWLFHFLAIPEVGLPAVFLISFVSATLVPLGSEPAVFAAVKAAPMLFWPVVLTATLGNTLGGIVDYWMGLGARRAFTAAQPTAALLTASPQVRHDYATERESRWFGWLQRYGAVTMLLAWVPVIGDPICTLAGWLRLPFWPSVGYMAIGKFLRYLCMTWLLLQVPDGFWRSIADWLG
jgi:membrane protein YqaA with SNARE-associated domain